MPTRSWISIITILGLLATIATAVVLSIVRGKQIDTGTLVVIAGAIGGGLSVTTTALGLFDRRLWRSRLFRLVPIPDAPPVLHGTWAIHVTYRERGAESPEALDAFLVIDQKFSSIKTDALYSNGQSRHMNAQLRESDGRWNLWFFYDFHPDDKTGTRRRGAAELAVLTRSPRVSLDGHFWNEMGHLGDMRSEGFAPGELFDLYGSAKAHFGRDNSRRQAVSIQQT